MRTASLLALMITLAVTTACKKNKPEGTGSGSPTTTGSDTMAGSGSSTAGSGPSMAGSGSGSDAAGSGSSMAGSGSGAADVAMQKGGGNCPSMVLGAETKAEVKGKTVVLTITATDKDAIAAIQKRTEEVLKEKSDDAALADPKQPPRGGVGDKDQAIKAAKEAGIIGGGAVHDQKGSHGGSMGLCPVYWSEGGKATSKKDPKGVVITITPKEKPEDLKATIDTRITKAAAWVKDNIKPGESGNQGGVGGGKGEHGSTHAGSGDSKGKDRKAGSGGGGGTGGGGGAGTGGGSGGGGGKGSAKPKAGSGGW